jgi:hypothetical protein
VQMHMKENAACLTLSHASFVSQMIECFVSWMIEDYTSLATLDWDDDDVEAPWVVALPCQTSFQAKIRQETCSIMFQRVYDCSRRWPKYIIHIYIYRYVHRYRCISI